MANLLENTLGTLSFDPSTGVATLAMAMAGGVNKVNPDFAVGLAGMLDALEAQDGLKGVIVTSAHKLFCVGADLDVLVSGNAPAEIFEIVSVLHMLYGRLENLGKPVVAAINGAALGGGYELCLACHRRIVIGDPRIQVGLPEVMLGLFPGGGGTQRLPRLIGIQGALEHMVQDFRLRPDKALKKGLVDEVVADADALREAALAWIAANPRAKQPWASTRFTFPGGVQPQTPEATNLYMAGAAMLYKRSAGAYRAPEVVMKVVQEGCRIQLDRALEAEGRAFAQVATSAQAQDMIRTLWFHKNAADKHEGLPRVESDGFRKITILGAGMMGAGLAYACAKAGYDVVLKDIAEAPLEAARARVAENLKKQRHLSADERGAIAGRITTTTSYDAVAGSDLVIEAVVENIAVKHAVIREVEPLLAEGAVFASNTSALPITDLAAAAQHKARFVGLHYFSPVEKMPLVEIIRGADTNDETIGRVLAFSRRIKKTPIVVRDGYGFFTTRLFSAYTLEGVQLVAEGHDPRVVEWAARTAGMAVGPLQVFDEVTLSLGLKAMQGAEAYGYHLAELEGVALLARLVEDHGRLGRAHGAGFYDYKDGRRAGIWGGLAEVVGDRKPDGEGIEVARRRLMLAQAAEVGRVLDDGILERFRDAEVGAVLGLGFAPNAGGPLAWMQRQGLPALVAELDAAAARWGDRYAPSETLRRMAAEGDVFFQDPTG